MKNNVVKVTLWGKTVGYVYWDETARYAQFQYEDDFVHNGMDIAPLTMPIGSERSRQGMIWPGDRDKLYLGLQPMLADSLPDRWGHSLFNAWLRENGIRSADVTAVDQLSFIGSRAMGALEFEPAQDFGGDAVFDVDVRRLYAFAEEVLNERKSVQLSAERSVLWQDLIKLGTSPGGKRPKAIVALNPMTGEVKSGQADAPEGFEHYILKYDDAGSGFPFARMEYVYYKLATAAGIEMMPSMLREYGGVTHFLTKRFDRKGNRKIHTQTLAAMAPGADSYEDLFRTIRRLRLPYKAAEQQYLRMVFNVLARNIDDHSKNFAFCMDQTGTWSLSPAYDVTYAVDRSAPAYVNRHCLTVQGKDSGITEEDLICAGHGNDISNPALLIAQVREAIAGFRKVARECDIAEELIKEIEKELQR